MLPILISPEGRLKFEFIDLLDEYAEIMTQDLAQDLIDLRDGQLCPNYLTKLCLNHGKGRLHVGPLMVML
jgi:hypothetical protein